MQSQILELPTFNPEDTDTEDTGVLPHVKVELRHEVTNLRLVLDPAGTNHDIFLERQADRWLVLIHPHASDPALAVSIFQDCIVVEDSEGQEHMRIPIQE